MSLKIRLVRHKLRRGKLINMKNQQLFNFIVICKKTGYITMDIPSGKYAEYGICSDAIFMKNCAWGMQ